jgi:hypothetical protein
MQAPLLHGGQPHRACQKTTSAEEQLTADEGWCVFMIGPKLQVMASWRRHTDSLSQTRDYAVADRKRMVCYSQHTYYSTPTSFRKPKLCCL